MRKRGLKDVKRRNRQVILQAILDSGKLSRVEIAQKTELAASTVSTLVSELLEQRLLVESGSQITAGRSRTELTLNPDYGTVAVVEISRKGVGLNLFDMALESVEQRVLSQWYLTGNELLETIVCALTPLRSADRPLAGIGLLFQEDMRESDFRVMYSTGFASASITLKEALMSEFRLPVAEDYAQVYTASNALEAWDHSASSIHIALGERVALTVIQQDAPVPIRGDFFDSASRYLEDLVPEQTDVEKLSGIIAILCMLFSIQAVFLSCDQDSGEGLNEKISEQLKKRLSPQALPEVRLLLRRQTERCAVLYARRLRSDILFNCG